MPAFYQEVAPEKWPEWFAEHRIDPIESGRRLEDFLRIRRAPDISRFSGTCWPLGRSLKHSMRTPPQRSVGTSQRRVTTTRLSELRWGRIGGVISHHMKWMTMCVAAGSR
jgi:hypothetical protein